MCFPTSIPWLIWQPWLQHAVCRSRDPSPPVALAHVVGSLLEAQLNWILTEELEMPRHPHLGRVAHY